MRVAVHVDLIVKSVTLEISLKPFLNQSDSEVLDTCRYALRQWDALLRNANELCLTMWSADGSEILDYDGNLDSEMEWARYYGNANPHMPVPNDREGKSLHARNYLFHTDAKPISYRRFAAIIAAWREAASEYGIQLQVGATFDPGGEFAPSTFKYRRHREICLSNTMGKASFVCCYTQLHQDHRQYAGFPDGIPEGLSLGTFLGRQFECFANDLGFDYIWFSNGFGFGQETWKTIGPLFDGEQFHSEQAAIIQSKILGFWRDFRKECKSRLIRTRGTNLGTGTDLASDATPLREIYEGNFNLTPPPNSPWAAINGDFGIELAGYMSRIVETPKGTGIPFRYYIHDPWWLNSPWIDRYEGQPHDIYLPLSLSRIDSTGKVETASTLDLFTIDDSHGHMPDRVPNECIPHLHRAWSEMADQAAPLVWLYPFDEMHDSLRKADCQLERCFHTDWFMREAINATVPVTSVISTRNFDALGGQSASLFAASTLITPSPLCKAGEKRLIAALEAGHSLIVYGPLDQAPELRKRLKLDLVEPVSGYFEVENQWASLDQYDDQIPAGFEHREVMSGGGLSEAPSGTEDPPILAKSKHGARALAAQAYTESGGRLIWLRGPLPLKISKDEHLPIPDNRTTTYPLAECLRQAIETLGWKLALTARSRSQRSPVICLHRKDNALILSGYAPDTTVQVGISTPYGAPAPVGRETEIDSHTSRFTFPRAWRHECRVYVEQASGIISVVEDCPAQMYVQRRLLVRGLQSGILRFAAPAEAKNLTFWNDPQWPFVEGECVEMRTVRLRGIDLYESVQPVSGTVLISW